MGRYGHAVGKLTFVSDACDNIQIKMAQIERSTDEHLMSN